MPQYIKVGEDVIEFPDGMSSQEIEATLQQQFGSPEKKSSSLAEQLARQVGLTVRGGVTGLTGPLQAVGDALNATINMGLEASGIDYRFQPMSQSTQQLMTSAGLPTPQTGTERAVQAGVEAMGGVGAGLGMAKAAPTMLSELGSRLGTQTAVAATSAPLSQVTAEAVQEKTENPFAGLAAGLAAGVVGGGATAKAIKLGQKAPSPVTIKDVQNQARQAYQEVNNTGITVKPLSALRMVSNARSYLDKYNFNPALPEHKSIDTLLNSFEKMIGSQRVKFETLEQMRSAATQMKMSTDPVTRLLAGKVTQSIDDFMGTLTPRDVITGQAEVKNALQTLSTARQKWRVAARAQALEDVLNIADIKALDPKASENELIRRGLINLLKDKKSLGLFNAQEREAIRKAASGGTKDSLLSLVARFNPARSQITAAGTVAGGFAYDPLTAMGVAAAGFGADKMQQAYRQKAVQDTITGLLTGQMPVESRVMQYRLLESSREGQQ